MNLASSIGLSSKYTLSFFHSLLESRVASSLKSPLFLFHRLLQSNLKPNHFTFSLLIKALASSPSPLNLPNARLQVTQIHTHLLKSGFNQFVYLNTSLLDLYVKLGCIQDARYLLEDMLDRDVIAWNALICGCSRNGYHSHALHLFVEMLREGSGPHTSTLVALVPSCARRKLMFQGTSIHGFGVKAGLDWDPRVKNVLTSMYAKCGDLEAVELLFDEMIDKSVVSWNTMIGAYGQNGLVDEALSIFKQMHEKNVDVSSVTIVSLLSANANPQTIHCFAMKTGIVSDASVVTSLVCAYVKHGDTESAELLYKLSPQENLVSLTAIISSYAQKGNMDLVVAYFAQLDMKLDAVAMVSVLHGFKNPAHIHIGLGLHCYGVKTGLCINCLVSNGLISMYFKFNDVEAAFSLFAEMQEKPLISWNSMISGYVQTGRSSDAMEIFCQLKMYGLSPDAITISSLLSGCSQLGCLQFGKNLHSFVLRNNLQVDEFVGTALIDMYTKCGSIEQAERVFKSIKEPCLAAWNAMIIGYSSCGFVNKALISYSELQEQGLKPDKITFLGILAACTHGGLVFEGRRYFWIMKEEFCMVPSLQHYACMVGLLSRAGLFEEAMLFIMNIDIEPDSVVWAAMLSGCYIHQEVKFGEYVAKKLYLLDYRNGGLYVLMSNLYANKGMWDDVAGVRKIMKDSGGDGCSGVSQIEVTAFEDMYSNSHFREVDLNKISCQNLFLH